MTFSFLSTTQDLVDAYDTQATKNARVRGVFRWLLLAFALLWLFGGIYTLIDGPERLKGLFFLACGAAILWQQAGRRLLDIYRIRKSNVEQLQTTLNFSAHGIEVNASSAGHFHKNWDQLLEFERARRGLLFKFRDGFAHWLPRRAFSSDEELEDLVAFLNANMRQAREAP